MIVLDIDDWKKKLPFDNVTYKNVKRYALRLNSIERALMNEEIDFYRSHFSLEQVMEAFKSLKTPEEIENFIKVVLKREDNILFLPICLKQHYKNRIKKEFSEFKGFFEILLNRALNASDRNPLHAMYKPLLGNYYKPIMSKIKKFADRETMKTYSRKIRPDAYDVVARETLSDVKSDMVLASMFGRSTMVGRLPMTILSDYGYGEWVSKRVSFATDRFYLHDNKKSLTEAQITDQILRNVYPGKAQFYGKILGDKPNICFDSGASIVIEGWADYASCHSKSMAFSYGKFYEKCHVAKLLLKRKLSKPYEEVWAYFMARYPKDRAIDLMVNCAGYPGDYLSSVIGHIGIYEILKTDFAMSPADLLDVFSGVNVGDYLAVYHPKVQRKLMDTSITAKVSKRLG